MATTSPALNSRLLAIVSCTWDRVEGPITDGHSDMSPYFGLQRSKEALAAQRGALGGTTWHMGCVR